MPSVYLDDDEVIELIIERPHLVGLAIQSLQEKLSQEVESWNGMSKIVSDLRKKIAATSMNETGTNDRDSDPTKDKPFSGGGENGRK